MDYVFDMSMQWFYAFSILAVLIAFPLRKMVGTVPAVAAAYFIINGAANWLIPTSYDRTASRAAAADSVAKLLLVVGAMLFLSRDAEKFRRIGGTAIALIGIACSVAGLFRPEGLTVNASMNAALIVVTLPIVVKHFGLIAAPLGIVAVFISGSSIGLGLLAALSVLWGLRSGWAFVIGAMLATAVLFAGYAHLGSELLNSSDRFLMWRFFADNWNLSHNWVFGRGFGTFAIEAYRLQNTLQVGISQLWWTLHNDWLECFLTSGLVGLVLLAFSYVSVLWSLVTNGMKHESAALVLFGLTMYLNFPLHTAVFILIGLWLVLVSLNQKQRMYS